MDPNTLEITTQEPAPYLPAMMLYSQALQKKALEAHGGLYNSDPATSVSAGPFVLKEWRKGDRLVSRPTRSTSGTNKPLIQKIINIGAAPAAELRCLSGRARSTSSPASAWRRLTTRSLPTIPTLQKETHPHYGDFRTDYLFFDNQNPPFNNLKVRQAFSHVVPRDDADQGHHQAEPGHPRLLVPDARLPGRQFGGPQEHPERTTRHWPSSCWPRRATPTARAFRS